MPWIGIGVGALVLYAIFNATLGHTAGLVAVGAWIAYSLIGGHLDALVTRLVRKGTEA